LIWAKKFREMTTEEIIESMENAISVLETRLGEEAHDTPTMLERALIMLDLAMRLQEMAGDVIRGVEESQLEKA